MSRARNLFSVVLPSMLAGGLLFSSAFGHAAAGDTQLGFWPAASDATTPGAGKLPTKPTPTPRTPPTPPTAPTAPTPAPTPHTAPTPPAPPRPLKAGGGVSVSVHNGTIQIDGVKDMALAELDRARTMLRSNPQIPKDVRDKLLARLDKVRATLDKRLSNLKLTDLDKLGDEMEKMGEEIEQAMEGLDDDMSRLGDKLGKDLAKQLGKDFGKNFGNNFHVDFDSDDDSDSDDDNVAMAPDVDIDADDEDMKDAISDLRDLALKPAQRDAITKLRSDSDKSVATAKKQVDDLSAKLQTALGNPATADAEVARYVDQISAQEAVIRKARILAWVQARRVLDDGQRKKIEDAAKKKTR
jgi:hypothetical protein